MTAFMKPGTAKALQKIAALTLPKCESCPSVLKLRGIKDTRCCDRMFCEIATVTMRELGGAPIEPTGHAELPYMGPEGCVVPPEFRPVCSGYVCPQQLDADPGFAARYTQLQERISSDPNVRRAVEKSRQAIGGLQGAIERFREEYPVAKNAPYFPGDEVWVTIAGVRYRGVVIADEGGDRVSAAVGYEGTNSFPREAVSRVSSEDTDEEA